MSANSMRCVAQITLETLMGLAALVSGPALIATNGLGMPTKWMENSPFGSYTIPGLVLLAVGVFNLAAVILVLRRHEWAAIASCVSGLLWVGWFVVQVAVVGFVSWQQPFYFVIGLLIIGLSIAPTVGWLRTRNPPTSKGALR